jgi:hypothetical protein
MCHMVRLDSLDDAPTGDTGEQLLEHVESARERGRRRALDIITGGEREPEHVADGGLHPDTIRWLEANPDADTEAALRYEEHTREHRDAVESTGLPPRGDPGAESNYARSVELNAARRAIRQYHDLEERSP